jgi:WD40 repeat protein
VVVELRNLCHIYDSANGELLIAFQLDTVGPFGSSFVVNADASRLLMWTDYSFSDSLVEVWDIPGGRRLFQFHNPGGGFQAAFSPDGKEIVTYYANNAQNLIRWWDPATSQKIKEIDAQQGAINGVIFTSDDKFWLSWGEDQTVKIHEASTDRLVRTLSPAAQIYSVIVSPNNHTIAVSLSTSQTTLYSFEDGHELVTLPGSSIGFLPDRQAVLNIIPGDSTVYAFILNNNDLVGLACERLKNITSSNGATTSQLKICQGKGQ